MIGESVFYGIAVESATHSDSLFCSSDCLVKVRASCSVTLLRRLTWQRRCYLPLRRTCTWPSRAIEKRMSSISFKVSPLEVTRSSKLLSDSLSRKMKEGM